MKVSDGNAAYAHSLPSIREIMETAIDKPVLFEYMPLGNENSYSQNADHDTSPILLAMAAGAASVRSMTTSGAPDLIVSEADYAPVEIYLIDAVAFSGCG